MIVLCHILLVHSYLPLFYEAFHITDPCRGYRVYSSTAASAFGLVVLRAAVVCVIMVGRLFVDRCSAQAAG